MARLFSRKRRISLPVVITALILLVAIGYAGAKWVAIPRAKAWRERRTNDVAREKLQQGDLAGAMTAVHTSLRYNQSNLDTWRLGAEIAAKQKSAEQLYFTQRIAQLQPTLENKLRFLKLALDYNAIQQAREMVDTVKAEGANSAEFLDLAATISRRTGNPTGAKYYLMSLLKLKPDNNQARFDLAQLRLFEGYEENKPAIRAEIRSLANDPELRPRALALLLADAVKEQKANEAVELAGQIGMTPNAAPTHQILAAEALHRFAPTQFTTYLTQLQKTFSENADKTSILASYLINVGLAADARQWIESLPEPVRTAEIVQTIQAQAMLQMKDWPALESFLRPLKWKENEYVRHAMLAHMYRARGDKRNFDEEWRLAVIETSNNIRRVQALLTLVSGWSWQDEKYEMLWKRFSIAPSHENTRQQLLAWETSRGNTAALNRLFARIIEVDQQDLVAKNNFAYTSLLLGTNMQRAYEIARELTQAEPKNPYYASTQALALYKQGKPREALNLLESVGAVALLSKPERMMMQALFLAESGDTARAADVVQNIRPNALPLPEERRLYTTALASISKAQREQGNVARLAAITAAQSGEDPSERKSWIALLPEQLRSKPSVQMELSDTLYANDDYRALESTLKNERWEENDFLRLALLTYAQRGLNQASSATITWRTAVAAAGSGTPQLTALVEMCDRWGWAPERLELLGRMYQRDPSDTKVFNELVEHFNKTGQTRELARLYERRLEDNPDDRDAKGRLAYYSLLTGTNLSRAHVLAKEAYDDAPENPLRAKAYALSLLKQSRGADSLRVLENLPEQKESGQAQTSLLRAAAAAQRHDENQSRALLQNFDASTALPEEAAMAESITRSFKKEET